MNGQVLWRTQLLLLVAGALLLPTSMSFAKKFKEVKAAGVTFQWKVKKDRLRVKLRAKTTGWVAVGFKPKKAMKGANFIIGFVKKGKVKVKDHFGTKPFKHEADKKLGGTDDVTNISGSEENGVTNIAFTIPLKSGDPKDKGLNPDKDVTVLLAKGTRDNFRSKHKKHAALRVNLRTGMSVKLPK